MQKRKEKTCRRRKKKRDGKSPERAHLSRPCCQIATPVALANQKKKKKKEKRGGREKKRKERKPGPRDRSATVGSSISPIGEKSREQKRGGGRTTGTPPCIPFSVKPEGRQGCRQKKKREKKKLFSWEGKEKETHTALSISPSTRISPAAAPAGKKGKKKKNSHKKGKKDRRKASARL